MLQSQYEHGRSHSDYGGTIRCRLCRQRFAHVEDRATRRVYLLVEQGKAPTLSDDYFSAKIAAAIAERDRGECEPWDVEQLKADLRRRHTASSAER